MKATEGTAALAQQVFEMNKQTMSTMMSSKKMDWQTPKEFFNKLNKEFNFTLDPATDGTNALCTKFFTEAQDALAQSWKGEVCYVNPPYGRQLKNWVRKAYEESKDPNTTVVMLIPARPDTNYWHEYVMHSSEIRFVRGRLKFGGGNTTDPAPFPSAVVVFRGGHSGQRLLCGPIVTSMERE